MEGSVGRLRAIHVRDTGMGIPLAEQERVFRSFEQVEMGKDRRFGGTGLGLPIARQLARMMGMELELESAPGEGSTFSLVFDGRSIRSRTALVLSEDPRSREVLESAVRARGHAPRFAASAAELFEKLEGDSPEMLLLDLAAPERKAVLDRLWEREETRRIPVIVCANPGESTVERDHVLVLDKPLEATRLADALEWVLGAPEGGSVLVVDDDPDARTLLSAILESGGYEVACAQSGQAGLDQLAVQWPDLVVLDLAMPGMDGRAFLEALRDMPRGRELPVVICTALNSSDIRRDELPGQPPFLRKDGIEPFFC